MTSVGAFEAKTHLARLLARVAKGEKILITSRGRAVAMLVPPETEKTDVKQTVEAMLAWRDGRGPTLGEGLSVRDLLEEGRRS